MTQKIKYCFVCKQAEISDTAIAENYCHINDRDYCNIHWNNHPSHVFYWETGRWGHKTS